MARLAISSQDVEDMVQETFARAWERAPSYRGEAAADVWLRGIALRVARSANRSPWRWRRRELPPEEPGREEPAREVREGVEIERVLARLPHKLREVLVLRYLEELDVSAIATELRCSRGAVDMRLSRARAALRELLPEGEFE